MNNNDIKMEQLEIATLLSRGSLIAQSIKACIEPGSPDKDELDECDALDLANTFLRLKYLLVTTREDREAMESTEPI